jgi:hypothetical protein
MLGRLDPVLLWPEVVAAHAIGGSGFVFVPILFVGAGVAIVHRTHWVMSVGPAIAAHVSGGYLNVSTPKTAAVASISVPAISFTAVSSAAVILLVCQQF